MALRGRMLLTALRLAREGARVGALGDTEDELREAVGRILAAGGKATMLPADVADARAMQRAVARLVETYGRLDVVVGNGGINGVWAPIDALEPAEFDARSLPQPAPRGAAPEARGPRVGRRLFGQRHAHVFTSAGATAYACGKAAQIALQDGGARTRAAQDPC